MRILYTAMIGTNCMMAVITASNIAPMSSRRLVPAISINRASPVLRLFVSIALLFIRLLELPSFYPLLFLPKIAHRLGTVIGANNIVVIDQGRVVQQGKHQALLAEEGLYRNLWEEQQRVKGWKF